jgi:hypothetical protein
VAKLVRPDINTKFHVDYEAWTDRRRDIRMLIREQLCTECKGKFGSDATAQDIDWVDPNTGEVSVVDGLRYCLRECCSRKEDYISRATPLTAAIFRTLIADGDTQMSAAEIHERIGRSDPKTLLRILLGEDMRTHYGVRPILGE